MNKKQQLTYHDVIDDTVKYYGTDTSRRSVRPFTEKEINDATDHIETMLKCVYNGKNNSKCAFARYVQPIHQPNLPEGKNCNYLLVNKLVLYSYLLDEVQHLTNAKFWYDIQQLHDSHDNWNPKKGLTKQGENTVKYLKNKYYE